MKCRVFKKPDGRVIYSWPTYKYQDRPNFEGCKFPPETEGLQFVDLDESELPSEEGRDWFSHGPLTMEGECKKENLKFDEGWECHLMPADVLRRKHAERLGRKIDEKIESEAADVIGVTKLLREKEKCQKWCDAEIYEQALRNLDEDGHAKPIIRQKLQEKLNALSK